MDDVQETILTTLGQKLGCEPQVTDSLGLLGIDSLAMAELTFEIERYYGIKTDEQLLDALTVADVIDYVRGKVQNKA